MTAFYVSTWIVFATFTAKSVWQERDRSFLGFAETLIPWALLSMVTNELLLKWGIA